MENACKHVENIGLKKHNFLSRSLTTISYLFTRMPHSLAVNNSFKRVFMLSVFCRRGQFFPRLHIFFFFFLYIMQKQTIANSGVPV